MEAVATLPGRAARCGAFSVDDVTALRAKAEKCRRLARQSVDQKTIQVLTAMAAELEAKAVAQSAEPAPADPRPSPRDD